MSAIFFLFLNTGPSNTALANVSLPAVRATAFAMNILVIHALGDAPSPRIIGWVSDHSTLRQGLAITLITLLLSALLIFAGAKYAPEMDAATV